jgi:hypothetical protein
LARWSSLRICRFSVANTVRTGEESAIDEAHAADGDELGEAELHARDLRREAAQAAVVLRLPGEAREAARQEASDRTEELAVADQTGDRPHDGEGDQLLVGGLAQWPRARDGQRAGEYVGCGDEGLQRSVHLVLQSRGRRAGDPLRTSVAASCLGGQPASSL